MATPMSSGNFGDLLDPRIKKIFYNTFDNLPSMKADLYDVQTSSDPYETWSEIGALGDFSEWNGQVVYQDQSQGYDVTATHLEFVSGIQVERKLFDDDRHNVWQARPVALADAAFRTTEKHVARQFNNAFDVDSYFYSNSEAVALCSDSHTTTSGASTTTGFDNKVTSALSAVSVAAMRIQMKYFKDDKGNSISMMPDELLVPIDLEEAAYEITNSEGKVETALNNPNFLKGKMSVKVYQWLTDTNNYFLMDSSKRKQSLIWFDKAPLEFGQVEDFDTFVAKWRAYMRYSNMWRDWRFCIGAQVS